MIGVAWAGEEQSANWFDIAREYTEKWHHQQQIRDAIGRPGLNAPHLLRALIETLLRALPLAYESTSADKGAGVVIVAPDLDGEAWLVRHDAEEWNLYHVSKDASSDAAIEIGSDALWRHLMKQMPRDEVRASAEITGASELAAPFFAAVAVMA